MANEKRLIDYSEIRKLFDEEFRRIHQLILDGETHLDNLAEGFHSADKVIWKLPTVDAVEVVRCKDCKMWKCHGMPFDITKGTCHNPRFHLHHGHVIEECFMPVTNETDFCSYGERREGE